MKLMRVNATIVAACALMLTSCSDPVEEAKARYEIVSKTNDKQAICKEGRKVAEAYLAQKNENEYVFWKAISDAHCLNARLDP